MHCTLPAGPGAGGQGGARGAGARRGGGARRRPRAPGAPRPWHAWSQAPAAARAGPRAVGTGPARAAAGAATRRPRLMPRTLAGAAALAPARHGTAHGSGTARGSGAALHGTHQGRARPRAQELCERHLGPMRAGGRGGDQGQAAAGAGAPCAGAPAAAGAAPSGGAAGAAEQHVGTGAGAGSGKKKRKSRADKVNRALLGSAASAAGRRGVCRRRSCAWGVAAPPYAASPARGVSLG